MNSRGGCLLLKGAKLRVRVGWNTAVSAVNNPQALALAEFGQDNEVHGVIQSSGSLGTYGVLDIVPGF